jgi:flagellar operon protein
MNQIPNGNFSSIEQIRTQFIKSNNKKEDQNTKVKYQSFREVLDSERLVTQHKELKFSKHAIERLSRRNINLTKSQLDRLETGTLLAGKKGIKDSLVIVDNISFIVNVKNNTVVTAVNKTEKDTFTNIDGAVIM